MPLVANQRQGGYGGKKKTALGGQVPQRPDPARERRQSIPLFGGKRNARPRRFKRRRNTQQRIRQAPQAAEKGKNQPDKFIVF
ncbi:MAG: hypothetical protein GXY95_02915 [Clostridiales bacterium]|jgi:hypothetical protein|nr:hypothetical protein [Clostridiales bacterium]HOJ35196.1 hypothetical protein [Clostridiales bacterium]HPP68482.1 hypothetical protein [Clostridiales bacterium]HPU66496.1 hypothetical protein [Clostridiales bacterium]HXK84264.1 hypothetical protein [Clostridiales bacterium]